MPKCVIAMENQGHVGLGWDLGEKALPQVGRGAQLCAGAAPGPSSAARGVCSRMRPQGRKKLARLLKRKKKIKKSAVSFCV